MLPLAGLLLAACALDRVPSRDDDDEADAAAENGDAAVAPPAGSVLDPTARLAAAPLVEVFVDGVPGDQLQGSKYDFAWIGGRYRVAWVQNREGKLQVVMSDFAGDGDPEGYTAISEAGGESPQDVFVVPDGRVFWTTQAQTLWLWDGVRSQPVEGVRINEARLLVSGGPAEALIISDGVHARLPLEPLGPPRALPGVDSISAAAHDGAGGLWLAHEARMAGGTDAIEVLHVDAAGVVDDVRPVYEADNTWPSCLGREDGDARTVCGWDFDLRRLLVFDLGAADGGRVDVELPGASRYNRPQVHLDSARPWGAALYEVVDPPDGDPPNNGLSWRAFDTRTGQAGEVAVLQAPDPSACLEGFDAVLVGPPGAERVGVVWTMGCGTRRLYFRELSAGL